MRFLVILLFLVGGVSAAVAENGKEKQGDVQAVRIEIQPSARLKTGDVIELKLFSPVSGHFTVLDVDKSGLITTLFPGVCDTEGVRLRAGVPFVLPRPDYGCDFPATEPGKGEIIVIVGKDHDSLDKLVWEAAKGSPLGGARFRGLEVEGAEEGGAPPPYGRPPLYDRLRAALAGRGRAWALGRVKYQIMPR